MAAEDGSINIKTSIDTSGINKGVNEVKSEIKNMSSDVNKSEKNTVSSFAGMAKGAAALAVAFKAVQTAAKAIKDTTAAYKVQAAAETQLQSAAKNNPYINGVGVANLKKFASQIQSVTTYGDETLLPLMAQLVSAGRSEQEVMDIISASTDLAASGTMSLETAVQQLNATYSGSVGQLGRQVAGMKDLTAEELKSGKAIEIVKKNYGGMAEEVANATGQSEQLNNAWGDLKETLGASLMTTLAPFEKGLTGLISKINETLDKARKLKVWRGTLESALSGSATYEQTKFDLEQLQKDSQSENTLLSNLYTYRSMSRSEQESANGKKLYSTIKKTIENYILPGEDESVGINRAIQDIEKLNAVRAGQIKNLQAQVQKMESEINNPGDTGTASTSADDIAAAAKANYDAAIASLEEEIRLKKQTGELTTEEEENEMRLQGTLEAYYNMRAEAGWTISDANAKVIESLKDINALFEKMSDNEKISKLKEALSAIGEDSESKTVVDSLKDQLVNLDELMKDAESAGIDETTDLYKEYAEKRIELEKEITEAQKAETQERVMNIMEEVNNTISQLEDIQSSITDLATSNITTVQETDLANAESQYEKGAISYEEYCDKIDEINKKAAKEQYKVSMAEWAMQLASATANIAQAVTKAYAEGGTAGIINGTLVAAAGAVQIAQLVANKPVSPSFATGGIVGGSSYYGDHVQANVNSGEMILNSAQQLALWKAANGGNGSGGLQQTIEINNTMSDKADVSATMSEGQIRVTVTEIVKSEFAKGTFNKSVVAASANAKGVRIL